MPQPGHIIKTVKAKKVRDGDFIPGLDNGYVPDTPERTGYEDNEVVILFHTAEGEEATLTCPKNMPITIERREE